MDRKLKIIQLEEKVGLQFDCLEGQDLSLPVWYNNVRKKRLLDLSDDDLIRFVRQNLFVDYIVFEGVYRLWNNPVMGSLYDGEFIAIISKLDKSFWKGNPTLKQKVLVFINSIKEREIDLQKFEWFSEEDEQDFWKNISLLEKKITKS